MSRRTELPGIIKGLMLAENFGDVHDEIDLLHDWLGIPRPDGDFLDGFTKADFRRVDALEATATNEGEDADA